MDNTQSQWRVYCKNFDRFLNRVHDIWIYFEAQQIYFDICDNIKRMLEALMAGSAAIAIYMSLCL
jgi:hypothetical protein